MRNSYVCKICNREMTRKWNYERHLKTVHRVERYYDNSSFQSLDYQPKILYPDNNMKIIPDRYKDTARFPNKNNNYPPFHSHLKPNYYESNLTIDSYSDFDTKKKLDNFTVKTILLKLSKLRLHLLSYFDEKEVNTILAYLYHESISQKNSKPIDDYFRF